MRGLRGAAAWGAAALCFAAGAAEAAKTDALCPTIMPECHFSVSGRKGPYLLKQVDPKKLQALGEAVHAKSGDAAKAGEPGKVAEAKSFAEQSINRGEFAAASLQMPETAKAVADLLALVKAKWPYADPGPVGVRMIGLTLFAPSAQPDGYIVVPVGLLDRAQSDDEVVWVLAHEYSHIALGHFARSAELAKRKQLLGNLVSGFATAVDISQIRASNVGHGIQFYSVEDMDARRKADLAWQRGQDMKMFLNVTTQAVSRDQEDQADAAGLDLTIAAGFDADDGAAQALDVLAEDEARAAAGAKKYQEEVGSIAKSSLTPQALNSAKSGDFGGAMTNFATNFGANLAQSLFEKGIIYLSQNHRPTAVRRKGVATYMEAAYPSTPPAELRKTWLTAVTSTAEYKEAYAAIAAHDLAQAARSSGDAKAAREKLQPALRTRFAATPLIANEAAAIADDLGETEEADRLYDEAEGVARPRAANVSAASPQSRTRSRPGSRPGAPKSQTASTGPGGPPGRPLINLQDMGGYTSHVELLVRMNSVPKAERKVKEAEAIFGDYEAFLPSLIEISLRNNKPDEVARYMKECSDTQDEKQMLDCRYATLDPASRKNLESMPPAQRAKIEAQLSKNDDNLTRSAGISTLARATQPAAGQTAKP